MGDMTVLMLKRNSKESMRAWVAQHQNNEVKKVSPLVSSLSTQVQYPIYTLHVQKLLSHPSVKVMSIFIFQVDVSLKTKLNSWMWPKKKKNPINPLLKQNSYSKWFKASQLWQHYLIQGERRNNNTASETIGWVTVTVTTNRENIKRFASPTHFS